MLMNCFKYELLLSWPDALVRVLIRSNFNMQGATSIFGLRELGVFNGNYFMTVSLHFETQHSLSPLTKGLLSKFYTVEEPINLS